MQYKIISLKFFLFLLFFTIFFIVPHIFQFLEQGIIISGDLFFYEGNFIESLDSLKIYIKENYLSSLNLTKNSIFIFFIVAAIFQTIITEI